MVCNSTLAGVTLSSSNLQVWFPCGKDFHVEPNEYFTPAIVALPAAPEVRPATLVCERHVPTPRGHCGQLICCKHAHNLGSTHTVGDKLNNRTLA